MIVIPHPSPFKKRNLKGGLKWGDLRGGLRGGGLRGNSRGGLRGFRAQVPEGSGGGRRRFRKVLEGSGGGSWCSVGSGVCRSGVCARTARAGSGRFGATYTLLLPPKLIG